jgi:hypothetical protein
MTSQKQKRKKRESYKAKNNLKVQDNNRGKKGESRDILYNKKKKKKQKKKIYSLAFCSSIHVNKIKWCSGYITLTTISTQRQDSQKSKA